MKKKNLNFVFNIFLYCYVLKVKKKPRVNWALSTLIKQSKDYRCLRILVGTVSAAVAVHVRRVLLASSALCTVY